MTALGIVHIHIITMILNAMHKAKAMELVKAEVLCIMLELCMHWFNLHGCLNYISMIGAGL